MTEGKITALAMIAMLAACAPKQDDKICLTPAPVTQAGDMQTCIHRWAYRLARSSDPAEVVAKATAQACSAVANEVADRLQKATTEQRSETFSGSMAIGEAEALFRVVQARAGKCDIP